MQKVVSGCYILLVHRRSCTTNTPSLTTKGLKELDFSKHILPRKPSCFQQVRDQNIKIKDFVFKCSADFIFIFRPYLHQQCLAGKKQSFPTAGQKTPTASLALLLKRPVLPLCVVDGRSRNPLYYYY